jgi:hypothetical protein
MKAKEFILEDIEPLTKEVTKEVINFYEPIIPKVEPGPVDNYVDQARNLLNKTDDPNIRSKMKEIFKKGKDHPAIQGGVVTAIAALLTGGLLSSASRMGLSPAQTNILLQAVLNTVIPTIIARINNKSWSETIKYTLASVGVGMTAAATLSEKRVTEGPKNKYGAPLHTKTISGDELLKYISRTTIKSIMNHPFFQEYISGHAAGYQYHRNDMGYEYVLAAPIITLKLKNGTELRRMVQFDLYKNHVENAHLRHNKNDQHHPKDFGNGQRVWDHVRSHKEDEEQPKL